MQIDLVVAIAFAFLGTIFNLAVYVEPQSISYSGGTHYYGGHSYLSSGSSHRGGADISGGGG